MTSELEAKQLAEFRALTHQIEDILRGAGWTQTERGGEILPFVRAHGEIVILKGTDAEGFDHSAASKRGLDLAEYLAALELKRHSPPIQAPPSVEIITEAPIDNPADKEEIERLRQQVAQANARADAAEQATQRDALKFQMEPEPPPFDALRNVDDIPEQFEDLAEPDELPADLKARLLAQFIELAHRFADDSGMLPDLSKDEKIYLFDIYRRNIKANDWLGNLDLPADVII